VADLEPPASALSLRLDIVVGRLLVWLSHARTLNDDEEPTAETHLFFFDRYQKLADHHRRRGHLARARRLQAKADEHWELSGGDGPPFAAAMGMPRPRTWLSTDAVSRTRGATARPRSPKTRRHASR
jgi:hypothetical protein